MKLYSKNNHVSKENGLVVKRFEDECAYRRELNMVTRLKKAGVAVPDVIESSGSTIVYEWINGVSYHTLVDCFSQQHAHALVDWLVCYHAAAGVLRGDVNLRNFLYCIDTGDCYGLDFEDLTAARDAEIDFGRLLAFAVTYAPPFSDSKRHCARLLLAEFENANADMDKIRNAYSDEIQAMIQRRPDIRYGMRDAMSFWEEVR